VILGEKYSVLFAPSLLQKQCLNKLIVEIKTSPILALVVEVLKETITLAGAELAKLFLKTSQELQK